MKRSFDFVAALIGLTIASPVLLVMMFLVWWKDKHSPFYVAWRVGRDERLFKMVKLRSMIVNADKTGVVSTAGNDNRITPVGNFIRRYKLDELTQLWNVLIGDMSMVGPRPNVKQETDLYTEEEKKLLLVKPGITDFASIVFSDEGDILKDYEDANLAYNQLIRPGKSRLGLFYIRHRTFMIDLQICFLTVIAVKSRTYALGGVCRILKSLSVDDDLLKIARREEPL